VLSDALLRVLERRFEDAVHGLPARVIGVTFSDTS